MPQVSWLGLPLSQLAVAFGLAGAFVVVLYLLKLRRRAVAVPFSPLWQRILADRDATRLLARLKRLLSLLVQLALLLLLLLALGDPRLDAASASHGRSIVVLLDASASMQATDVAPSRLAVAKEEVRKLLSGVGGADRVLLAQMDAAVTPLSPMSGDTSELERALANVSASDAPADFPRGLRFAKDVLRGLSNPEIVVVSDGHLTAPRDAAGEVTLEGMRLSYVPVGKGADNVAITQFAVRRYALDRGRYEVLLEVTNTGAADQEVELSLLGDGKVVDVNRLRIRAGERLTRSYADLSGANRTLEALLSVPSGGDFLAVDNHVYALLPERRRAKVLLVTTGNTYLEAAFLLDEYLEVTDVTPALYPAKIAASRFDAVVFDRFAPSSPPKAPALYLAPSPGSSPVKVGPELQAPGFDRVERKHPLLRFISLEDVNVARGRRLAAEPGDTVVGASNAGPILIAGTRGGYKFAVLGFDVRESDFPLRVAWPVFLMNGLRWFIDDDVDHLSTYRTGEIWRIPVGSGVSHARLRGPSGEAPVAIVDGRATWLGQRAGYHELVPVDGAGGVAEGAPVTVAANLLDIDESTLRVEPKLAVGPQPSEAVQGFRAGVRREFWLYLLLAVVLISLVEWATYHRRLTV